MSEFVPIVFASLLVWRVVAFVKQLTSGAGREALTQAIAWAAGIGVAFLLAGSDFAGGIDVAGVRLEALNGASVVLFGFALGSAGSTVQQGVKALDSSQSAAEPKLALPPK